MKTDEHALLRYRGSVDAAYDLAESLLLGTLREALVTGVVA